ncbi:hypothetical protein [Moorena sp. SIO3H5]|uniref:hypothetical protein n=1 Tax=Moorena sp. SIO3H5 TaxID=2607834 RepID=UPI0013BE3DA1|nr:hypothetical protein [Moorena sp. SIO3H5]NEO70159.1 hypothetical protein [Moorena sp. SIO3H5]
MRTAILLITDYSFYHSYKVHIIFSLLPAPCSLLPAPCSLLPKTQRFVPHGYNTCYKSLLLKC